jgi:dihydroorotate dehydrogenase (fumarate)
MTDLSTTYLGLKLKNPLVAGAAYPLSENVDKAKRLEDSGLAAIVMYSLFEEQIVHESLELDHYLTYGTESYAEATSYYPQADRFKLKAEAYVDAVAKIKQAVSIPVIGSLNGVSSKRPVRMRSSSTCTTCRSIRSSPAVSWRTTTSSWSRTSARASRSRSRSS